MSCPKHLKILSDRKKCTQVELSSNSIAPFPSLKFLISHVCVHICTDTNTQLSRKFWSFSYILNFCQSSTWLTISSRALSPQLGSDRQSFKTSVPFSEFALFISLENSLSTCLWLLPDSA